MWYTINKVGSSKEWDSKYGKMISYDVDVVDAEGQGTNVQLNQKLDTPAPVEGGRIHGYIENTDYGNKFKKTQPEDGSSSSSAPRSSAPADDARGVSIERQAMVKAACALLAGTTDNPYTVLGVADVFVTYVQTGTIAIAPDEIPDHVGGAK